MKISVPITRSVEVHAHNYFFNVRYNLNSENPIDVSLGCICGNGLVIPTEDSTISGTWIEFNFDLSTVLEIAAAEQERKHKDW